MVKISPAVEYGLEIFFHFPLVGSVELNWNPKQEKQYLVINNSHDVLKGGFSTYQEAEAWCQEMGYSVEV